MKVSYILKGYNKILFSEMNFIFILAILAVITCAFALPLNYDLRDVFPACTRKIYDQKNCSSSWAHAIAGVMSDRYCISHDKHVLDLSPQDLVCSSVVDERCTGTFNVEAAFNYAQMTGLRDRDCLEYTADKVCPENCTKEGVEAKRYKCGPMNTLTTQNDIKTAISEKGPVICLFNEGLDFVDYFEGMYYPVHPKKRYQFQTAIKLIGWGSEGSLNFWIAETSLSDSFGENGYARLRMGNFCNVAYYCDPQ